MNQFLLFTIYFIPIHFVTKLHYFMCVCLVSGVIRKENKAKDDSTRKNVLDKS